MKLIRDGHIHIVFTSSTEEAMRIYRRLCAHSESSECKLAFEPFDRATIRARFLDNQTSRTIIKGL